MPAPTQSVRSMLDVDDTTSTPRSQSQQQDQTSHGPSTFDESRPLPRPPTSEATDSGLSASTYAQFRPQTPPTQTEHSYSQGVTDSSREHNTGPQVYVNQAPTQHSEARISRISDKNEPEQYSQNQLNHNEALTHAPQSRVNTDGVNAKDALAPIAGAPTYDNSTASSGPTLKDRAEAMVASTAEKANVLASNAAAQAQDVALSAAVNANLMAHNAADRLNESVSNTAETAKLKVMANPTVQDTAEQLRENFSADSHEMARKDYGIQGAVQRHQGVPVNGVRDVGWHRPNVEIPDPLIGGIPNARLFALIRRFNKDVFDVRAVPLENVRGLDLNDAWSDKHASDKITLHLQRMYLSVILGLVSFGKHVARLRSWKETRRTGAFCAVYFTAWAFDLLLPLVLGTLIALVSSKEARDLLFPPAPLALVNATTGGLQKPQAGQLGTTNTLTGAPEKQPGEAAEEEAANFVDNIRHLVARAMGMHEKEQNEGDPLEGKLPKPVRNAAKAIKSAGSAPGHAGNDKDLTQKPMEEILWAKLNPKQIEQVIKTAPHVVGEIVDNWERFANAISPTPPFNKLTFLRIDAVLAPAFLVSLFINYYMVYKGIGFAIGFGIFGDPILTPSLQWLNKNCPSWMELLEPKNNILRGVPTNNQLTLTLLRIGEANHTPLPPVPSSKPDDPDQKQIVDVDDIPLDATDNEITQAVHPSGNLEKSYPQPEEQDDEPKHKTLSKFMRVLKGNTKASVKTKLAVDHVRAKAGNEKAKGHLGVLPEKKNLIYAGPSEYKARYEGKKGWIYITDNSVLFSQKERGNRSSPEVEIPFASIKGLKRATAFSLKAAEMAADWGTEADLLGSVEIDGLSDKTWRFTALPERDELFNRLIAIGGHRWENL